MNSTSITSKTHPGVTCNTVPRNALGQPPPHPVVSVVHLVRLHGHQPRHGKAVPLGLFFWGLYVYVCQTLLFVCTLCLCLVITEKKTTEGDIWAVISRIVSVNEGQTL